MEQRNIKRVYRTVGTVGTVSTVVVDFRYSC